MGWQAKKVKMIMEEEKKFNKILIAKYSPDNKCLVEDGGILTVTPKKKVELKDHVKHHFVDSLDKKTKSQYGWVKKVENFSFNDFKKKYAGDTQDQNEVEHIKTMLESISNLDEDIPVAATYSERGVEKKRMDFTVHRVFFRG
jgi:hypothetical protein